MADVQEQEMKSESAPEVASEPVVQPEPQPEWGEDITPDKDGGVYKAQLSPPVENVGPYKGDEVFVHYTGKFLSGEIFDTSVERNETFKFKLGSGTVIKAWDVGVATLKKGEKCLLTCRPEYAYGEDGSPPKIPGSTTLQFEVELISWQGEDLTNDGGVRKSIVKEGKDYSRPSDGTTCNVHLKGSIVDGPMFEERDVTFEFGEGSESGILPGIETAIGQMKNEEVAKVVLQPKYAFGAGGSQELGVPGDVNILYNIRLNSFQKAKAPWEYDDINDRKSEGEKLKERGTNYFKQGKYSLATKLYEHAAELVSASQIYKEEEKEAVKALRIALHLNLAACHLKLNESSMALKQCNEVLELDPENVKGYFRRGQSQQLLQDFEEATSDFQQVLKLEPGNKAAQKQLAVAKKKVKAERDKERRRYANMFKYSDNDEVEEESSSPHVEEMKTGEAEEEPAVGGDGGEEKMEADN